MVDRIVAYSGVFLFFPCSIISGIFLLFYVYEEHEKSGTILTIFCFFFSLSVISSIICTAVIFQYNAFMRMFWKDLTFVVFFFKRLEKRMAAENKILLEKEAAALKKEEEQKRQFMAEEEARLARVAKERKEQEEEQKKLYARKEARRAQKNIEYDKYWDEVYEERKNLEPISYCLRGDTLCISSKWEAAKIPAKTICSVRRDFHPERPKNVFVEITYSDGKYTTADYYDRYERRMHKFMEFVSGLINKYAGPPCEVSK